MSGKSGEVHTEDEENSVLFLLILTRSDLMAVAMLESEVTRETNRKEQASRTDTSRAGAVEPNERTNAFVLHFR